MVCLSFWNCSPYHSLCFLFSIEKRRYIQKTNNSQKKSNELLFNYQFCLCCLLMVIINKDSNFLLKNFHFLIFIFVNATLPRLKSRVRIPSLAPIKFMKKIILLLSPISFSRWDQRFLVTINYQGETTYFDDKSNYKRIVENLKRKYIITSYEKQTILYIYTYYAIYIIRLY